MAAGAGRAHRYPDCRPRLESVDSDDGHQARLLPLTYRQLERSLEVAHAAFADAHHRAHLQQ